MVSRVGINVGNGSQVTDGFTRILYQPNVLFLLTSKETPHALYIVNNARQAIPSAARLLQKMSGLCNNSSKPITLTAYTVHGY